MKYAVNVSWGMFGTLYVEAENKGHARLLANALPTPEGAYIEGSFKLGDVQLDEDAVEPFAAEGLRALTDGLTKLKDSVAAPSRITNEEAELNQRESSHTPRLRRSRD